MIPSRDMVDHQDATGGRCPVHGTRLVLVMAAVLAGVLLAVWGGQGGSWSPRPALAVDWNVIQVPFESSYILPYKLTENYLLFSAGEDSQAELYVYDIGADSVDQLTFNEYEDGLADMDGSYAVWSAKADGDYEIFLRNLATDQTTRLTNNSRRRGTSPDRRQLRSLDWR